jgi:hypothetical protein
MHDGRTFSQMSSKAHAVSVGYANATRRYVVSHPRKLVDRCDSQVMVLGSNAIT